MPRDKRGIYMLWDHEGVPRYIGIVEKESFHKRIDGRHRGGSEENSHKFSAAYNTGRMWRDRKRIGEGTEGIIQTMQGAAAAKRVRMEFIRQYCRATYHEVSTPEGVDYGGHVRAVEASVQGIARKEHRLWETQARIVIAEPAELVGTVVIEMIGRGSLDEAEVILLEKQRFLYDRLIS